MRKRKAYILIMVLIVAAILTACSLAGARSSLCKTGKSDGETGVILADIPEYDGEPSVQIDGNVPDFGKEELKVRKDYQNYGNLDRLGRCTMCEACVSKDMMPESDVRDDISGVHPSGWMSDQGWERCHLIARCLTAQEANVCNLITGTHHMNVDGMLPYEIEVANYVRDTGHHVMYRVTPIYDGDNLIASGVHMEAQSIEDDEVSFNVFCYNLYPDTGTHINYITGEITRDENAQDETSDGDGSSDANSEQVQYVLNTNTMKIHIPTCKSVQDMADHNKKEVSGTTIAELEQEGYTVCGNCHAGQE